MYTIPRGQQREKAQTSRYRKSGLNREITLITKKGYVKCAQFLFFEAGTVDAMKYSEKQGRSWYDSEVALK